MVILLITNNQTILIMPSIEQILAGLSEITNKYLLVSVFWHLYFAALAVVLIFKIKLSKRTAGIILSLPLFSVSTIAWLSMNPFNGFIFAMAGIMLVVFSLRLPPTQVEKAPLWLMIPGVILAVFGWIYPHFLESSTWLSYLYAAPVGVIPCATLSIVIGFALLMGGLGSKAISLTLAVVGLFYGFTGVFQLGVQIDWFLLAGSIVLFVWTFLGRYGLVTAIVRGEK